MRKAISKKLRFEIFKRDNFKCQYCGDTPPNALLHVDHIVAVKNGGQNDSDNLITSCQNCNLGKGATSLDLIPQSLADKAAIIKEREEQLSEYNKILFEARDRLIEESWIVANEFLRIAGRKPDSINKLKFNSIKKFVELQGVHPCLDALEILDAANVSGFDSRFRYFCGVMWGKIRNRGNE